MVLFMGTVLAVALMSSGVVFTDLMEEAALRRVLVQATPEQANFTVRTYNGLDDPALVPKRASIYKKSTDVIDQYVGVPFQPYLQDQTLLLQTISFFFKGHPQLELNENVRPRGMLSHMSGLFPERVELVEGRWPYSSADGASISLDQPLEVAIDTTGAELIHLSTGDALEIFPAISSSPQTAARVKIVGIFQRIDPDDEFWYGVRRTFGHMEGQVAIVPLFTTEDAILEYAGRNYPGSYAEVQWFFFLNRSEIRARDVEHIQDTIQQVKKSPPPLENTSITIGLDDLLKGYQEQILLARIPLYLMISLTTGILVYYLSLVSGLVIKSRSTETSLLKSRGITTPQIGLVAFVEGLLLAVPAVLLGPLLALAISTTLGRLFIEASADGGPIPVSMSFQAFLLGTGGALLAVTVLTISSLVASRKGLVEFRQSGARPPQAPFIHRSYLDVLALVLIGLIWWQIQSRGSFLVRSLGTGELEVDISLLMGPVLGLLALGLLVMRFFPLVMALAARMLEPLGPVWLVQGLRRVSRDPIMAGALVVLLMLTTALGVIGSTFSSTIEQSQRDRALYLSGADLRVEYRMSGASVSLLGMSDLSQRLDAVENISETLRTTGTLSTSAFDSTDVSVLAVDTSNFADVAWYRKDFVGGRSLPQIMELLSPDPGLSILEDGIRLPPTATSLALWANPGAIDPVSTLIGRIRDDGGYYFDVSFGRLGSQGWRQLNANLVPPSPFGSRRLMRIDQSGQVSFVGATPPFTLISLRINSPSRDPGAIFLGQLSAVTPSEEIVLGDYHSFLEYWHIVEDYDVPGLSALESSSAVAQLGAEGSAALSWGPGGLSPPSIRAGRPEVPLTAVVSRSLLDLAESRPGDTLALGTTSSSIPIRAVATADYFPTLNPREEYFIVVDLRTFTHYMNLHGQNLVGGSNELWVNLADDVQDSSAIAGELRSLGIDLGDSYIAADMVSERVNQPLVNAGWSGLLILMFLALVLASASGVMLYSYTDTQERNMEYAILRTLGFSRGQLNRVVWFNLLLVVIFGIGLGTWTGQRIGISILPILEVAEGGIRVTPPMIMRINWGILLITYLVLAVVAASTVVWLAWITMKLEVQRVLRIGEA